jgi:hypothetical protein
LSLFANRESVRQECPSHHYYHKISLLIAIAGRSQVEKPLARHFNSAEGRVVTDASPDALRALRKSREADD